MRIGIFSKNNNFMPGIFAEMKRRGHELEHYAITEDGRGLLIGNEFLDRSRFMRMLDRCDVAYVEFIEDLAYDVSIWKYVNEMEIPLVMRLHRIELYEPYVRQIPWHVVNDLIFVAPQCLRKFRSIARLFPERTHVIPNGYDSDLFTLPENKTPARKQDLW